MATFLLGSIPDRQRSESPGHVLGDGRTPSKFKLRANSAGLLRKRPDVYHSSAPLRLSDAGLFVTVRRRESDEVAPVLVGDDELAVSGSFAEATRPIA